MQWGLKWEQGAEPPEPPHFNHCSLVIKELSEKKVREMDVTRARAGFFIGGKTEGPKAESGCWVLGEGHQPPPLS